MRSPTLPDARPRREGAHVTEMQRRRLLTATLEVVYERGAPALTAASVVERAGVSRRTFYDIFEDRQACVLAAFNDAAATAEGVVVDAAGAHDGWCERVRGSLWALLALFDRQPHLARVLVVEALASGPSVLRARRELLDRLALLVDEGRVESGEGREPPPLTGEGVVGAVFSLIHSHLISTPASSLLDLIGPLMAIVVAPYLGPTAAQQELELPTPAPPGASQPFVTDPFKDLTIRLTYRTLRVLTTIAQTPGASSKQVALCAGITDEGQTSKLLKRLQRNDLIDDTGKPEKGMPRAWTLTDRGERVLAAVGG